MEDYKKLLKEQRNLQIQIIDKKDIRQKKSRKQIYEEFKEFSKLPKDE